MRDRIIWRNLKRLLRRSKLPFHRTQGFHPHPRLVFALSLPLGVVGCEEVAELELDEVLPVEEVLERLRGNSPPGLEILSVQRVSLKSSPQVRALCYRLPVPAERTGTTPADTATTPPRTRSSRRLTGDLRLTGGARLVGPGGSPGRLAAGSSRCRRAHGNGRRALTVVRTR